MKAVSTVFPHTLDFICHFHFLRDLGKDLLEPDYATIRQKTRESRISPRLQRRLRVLKPLIENNGPLLERLASEQPVSGSGWSEESLKAMPVIAACSFIQWALEGKSQGNGYGFPFDRPYLVLLHRLRSISTELEFLRTIHLRGDARDNRPLHAVCGDLQQLMTDESLWTSVARLEADIKVFEKLRKVLRIAPTTSSQGLNHPGNPTKIGTIKAGVEAFQQRIVKAPGYAQNIRHQKMIAQIEKYWHKLFADPIKVETPEGISFISPQRTNNCAEQHFRDVKRGFRKKTGHGSLGSVLRTMLANTPLVKNLQNGEYMNILLQGKSNLEEVFADIERADVRHEMKKSREHVEKISPRLKTLTNTKTYPEVLRHYFTEVKSNRIL